MAIFNSYVSHYQRVPRVMIKRHRTGGHHLSTSWNIPWKILILPPSNSWLNHFLNHYFPSFWPLQSHLVRAGRGRKRVETCGGLEHFLFFHILGISSSQLTFIFFRGGIPPTCHEILMKSHLNSSICSFAVASIAMFRNGKWSKSAGPQQSGALRRGRGWSSERAAGTVGSAGGWRGDRPTGSDILGLVGSQNLQEMIVVQSPPFNPGIFGRGKA